MNVIFPYIRNFIIPTDFHILNIWVATETNHTVGPRTVYGRVFLHIFMRLQTNFELFWGPSGPVV